VIDPLDVVKGAGPEALAPAMRNKFPQGMPAYGADALRFTLASLTQQGRDIKLSLDRVAGYKAFTNKLWNASRFAMMNLGDFKLSQTFVTELPLTLADRWILSRLNQATAQTVQALEAFQFSEAAQTLYKFVWNELCDWYIELAKAGLQGTDPARKAGTRAVLVFCLDRVLRLLHPFMPFITEEIWQRLPMDRPTESIMVAPYPAPDRRLENAAAEAEMAPVIAAIEGVRSLRGENNLPPSAKIEAHVQSPNAEVRKTLERWRADLMPLAGIQTLVISAPGHKPPQSAAFVGSGLEIYVPLAGLIDLGEERARLGKELAKVEADLSSLKRKHENPNFLARAPAEVVEKDKARIEELTARKAKLEDNLGRLAPSEANMSDPNKPGTQAPPVTSVVTNPDTARVRIAQETDGPGSVDLREELKGDLEAAGGPPQADPNVESALKKLREGTKDLSQEDHYQLGVAYMGMGLVDDAVREFNAAKTPEKKKPAGRAVKKLARAIKKVAKAVRSKVPKKPARKVAKKVAKKPGKKATKKPAKKPAKKAAAKRAAKAKKPTKRR
jgi:valyl-tRNA synthetase